MGSIRGQTVLVTGRVDGQLLYVKPSSGPEKSLLVRDLLRAADDADVNLVMLQSASTPRQPGGRNWFWQKVEVKGLDDALQRPRMADFLNALAGPGRRFAVSATPSGTLRTGLDIRLAPDLPGTSPGRPASEVFADLVADVAGRVLTDGVQASLRNAERQQELDQRIVPGIPSEAQFLYILLMVIGLLGLPVSRRWWRRLWPPEQAGEYPIRGGYWAAAHGARRDVSLHLPAARGPARHGGALRAEHLADGHDAGALVALAQRPARASRRRLANATTEQLERGNDR